MAEAFAPAKINLTLHVTGQRADGYHLLDSLVAFADVGDRLRVAEGQGVSLSISGPMADGVPDGPENSILQAAGFLGQGDLAFQLEKHLPAAAGIGGGTSDAAAALRAVCELRGLPTPRPDEVLPLGADVPVCLHGRVARMEGIGGQVTPLPPLPPVFAVLANPRVAVATPAVFKALSRKNNPPMPAVLPQFSDVAELAAWLRQQRNDLQAPAMLAQPVIAQVLSALEALPGQRIARMSGSGATCFALFDTRQAGTAAAQALSAQQPGWWVTACALS